jgi:hypothetical protein
MKRLLGSSWWYVSQPDLWRLVAWTGFFLIVSPMTATGADRLPPPNIVVIVADDLRADALGCMGHPIV